MLPGPPCAPETRSGGGGLVGAFLLSHSMSLFGGLCPGCAKQGVPSDLLRADVCPAYVKRDTVPTSPANYIAHTHLEGRSFGIGKVVVTLTEDVELFFQTSKNCRVMDSL